MIDSRSVLAGPPQRRALETAFALQQALQLSPHILPDLCEAGGLGEHAGLCRADILRELLQHCTSVKTVRLCLQLGRELSLPWAAKLDPAQLPTGSDRRWVSRCDDGLLVLKP